MNENELDFRIKLAIAKCRNLIYYRELDDRLRAQYIHVVRDYRKLLVKLIPFIPDTEKYLGIKSLFQKLINTIDPKVKSEGCIETILQIKKLFYNE